MNVKIKFLTVPVAQSSLRSRLLTKKKQKLAALEHFSPAVGYQYDCDRQFVMTHLLRHIIPKIGQTAAWLEGNTMTENQWECCYFLITSNCVLAQRNGCFVRNLEKPL